jgi:hypothetical protein
MHRLRLNADQKNGSVTLRACTLNVGGTSVAAFVHHDGIRPHRIEMSVLPAPQTAATA